MLVLSRRVGQQIRIGPSVVVTLLKVERNKARIGVEAPPNIPVYRQELLEFEKAGPASTSDAPAPEQSKFHNQSPPRRRVLRHIAGPRFLWDNAAG
jgi:carbon storage regulator